MPENIIPMCEATISLGEAFQCDPTADYSKDVTVSATLNNLAVASRVEKKYLDSNGQTRDIKLIYDAEFCDLVADGCPTNVCTTTKTAPGQASQTISIDPCSTSLTSNIQYKLDVSKFKESFVEAGTLDFSLLAFRPILNGSYLQRQMYKAMKSLEIVHEDKNASQLVGLLNATTGGFSQDDIDSGDLVDEAKPVKTIIPTNGDISDLALTNITYSAQMANFCSTPIVFGGKQGWTYSMLVNNACCTSNGLDLKSLREAVAYDFVHALSIEKLLGAPYLLSMEPGSIQKIDYQRYNGVFQRVTSETIAQVIISPVTGSPIDVFIKLDPCANNGYGSIVMTMQMTSKVVGLPDDLFCEGSAREGVNGLQKFKIVNS